MQVTRDIILSFCEANGLNDEQSNTLLGLLGHEPILITAEIDETVVVSKHSDLNNHTVLEQLPTSSRYTLHERIGVGGMGEIFRSWDSELHRFVAVKILKQSKQSLPASCERFIKEAKLSGGIQHANIVPIYQLAQLSDGRLFYSMPEIVGRSLSEVLTSEGWSLRRTITVLIQVVEAVGFAQSQNVAHLDLKPSNIMIANNGSVYLVDWGLAQPLNQDGLLDAQLNTIEGTPTYMAPEQARGDLSSIGIKSDIYALGSILYEILSGQAPYIGKSPELIMKRLITQPPPSLRTLTRPLKPDDTTPVRQSLKSSKELPEELIEVCERAMVRNPAERTLTATEFRQGLQQWIDGVKQKEKAELNVSMARKSMANIKVLEEKVETLKSNFFQTRGARKPNAALKEYRNLWQKERALFDTENNLAIARERLLQHLNTALNLSPSLLSAHLCLIEYYTALLDSAEANGEISKIELHRFQIKSQMSNLPKKHPQLEISQARLDAIVKWSLSSSPSGATVTVYRYEEVDYRLQENPCNIELKTPIVNHSLPAGSYQIRIECSGYEETCLPLNLSLNPISGPEQKGHNYRVELLKKGLLNQNECYVPAGFFIFGNGEFKLNSGPIKEVWLDGFIAQQFPICQREALLFLNDLKANGENELIESILPRHHAPMKDHKAPSLYTQDADGNYILDPRKDADGDRLKERHPALSTSFYFAEAYAKWLTKKMGLSETQGWSLPSNHQWEKMAKGADNRRFPWGNRYAPQWAHSNESHPTRSRIGPIDSHPIDCSPYGVRSLAGCIREWTKTKRDKDGSYDTRGSSWYDPPRFATISAVHYFGPHVMYGNIGFRLVRPIPKHS